jgi:hypothetical protein
MSTTANLSVPLSPDRRHETRAAELVAALAAGPAIAAIVVAMRVYTRFIIIRKRFWEDYSILAALACSIAMSVFVGISKWQLLSLHPSIGPFLLSKGRF